MRHNFIKTFSPRCLQKLDDIFKYSIRTMSNEKYQRYRNMFTKKEQIKMYASNRPAFPDGLFQKIFDFCKDTKLDDVEDTNREALAVDVGCGPGNNTVQLTKMFKQVIGVDVSSEQLKFAPRGISGVTFKYGRGENLSFLSDNSVDLVINAASLHWLPIEKYFQEVERVLKPGGTFAVFSRLSFVNIEAPDREMGRYLRKFVNHELRPYLTKNIDDNNTAFYYQIQPFDGWERVEYMTSSRHLTASQLLGLIQSYSYFVTFEECNPDRNIIKEIRDKLKAHGYLKELNEQEDRQNLEEAVFDISWPTFLLMARKPLDNK